MLPHSRPLKRVSFADGKGLSLAHVRVVTESPDEPPTLNPEIILALTRGEVDADLREVQPFKLCFSQPSSDYSAFISRVNSGYVCVESVLLRNVSVSGTVKVKKGISMSKRVFVRFSFDEWVTYEDYECSPVNDIENETDVFYFKVEIPSTFDTAKQIQFTVCFECNGNQYWDDNNRRTYTIVSQNYGRVTHSGMSVRYLPERNADVWSEFSASPTYPQW